MGDLLHILIFIDYFNGSEHARGDIEECGIGYLCVCVCVFAVCCGLVRGIRG
jgi:hypothetical protein